MYTNYVHCGLTYVTIVHILVLQSDSGFSSHGTPPAELEDVDKHQRSVYTYMYQGRMQKLKRGGALKQNLAY